MWEFCGTEQIFSSINAFLISLLHIVVVYALVILIIRSSAILQLWFCITFSPQHSKFLVSVDVF